MKACTVRIRTLRPVPAVFLRPIPSCLRTARQRRLDRQQLVCLALGVLAMLYLAGQVVRAALGGGVS
jgi:hypothetical protein